MDSYGRDRRERRRSVRISREDQDRFACSESEPGGGSRARGRFAVEIAPVDVPGDKRGNHQTLRAGRIHSPRHVAGHAGQAQTGVSSRWLCDGGQLIRGSTTVQRRCSLPRSTPCRALGLQPIARVVATAVAGVEPRIMGMGPVPASRLALAKAKLTLDAIDVLELNEAFAAQSVACLRELGVREDRTQVNPNGGAIALGHPLGMSGTRIDPVRGPRAASDQRPLRARDYVHWRGTRHGHDHRTRLSCAVANIFEFDGVRPVVHDRRSCTPTPRSSAT